MAVFDYEALDNEGKYWRGMIEAEDRQAAQMLLRSVHLLTLTPHRGLGGKTARKRSVRSGDLAAFCQQLSVLLDSGLSLQSALSLLAGESKGAVRALAEELLALIGSGLDLSRALALSGHAIPPVLVEMAAVGEKQGRQGESMALAASYFEEERTFQAGLVGALAYPLVVLVVMLAALAAMLLVVAPSLAQTYSNLDAPMPWLTQMVVSLGQRFGSGGWRMVLGVILVLAAMVVVGRSRLPKAWRWPAGFYLRLPLVGALWQERQYSRFARTLGQLLAAGVPMKEALTALGKGQSLQRAELESIRERILRGETLSSALADCSFVPRDALAMVRIGEESGRLEQMLLKSGLLHGQNFKRRVMLLMRLVEPALLVVLGLLILAVAAGLFLPIINSYQFIV